jgi:hypothetical protein
VSALDDIRLFKRSVVAWTLRVAALLLLVAVAIGRKEVTLGLVFGLCVGLMNFELMVRFNAALLRSGDRGRRVAVIGTLVRMALIFAGAAAVHYKGWDLIAAAVGCFIVYPVLWAHGLLIGHRSGAAPEGADTAPADAKR